MKKNHSNKGKIAAAITAASALTVALGITAIAAPLGGAPDASQKPDTNAEVRFEQEAGFAQNHNGPFSFEGLQNPDSPEFNGERPEGLPEFNGEKPEGMPEFNGERPEGMPEFNGERPEGPMGQGAGPGMEQSFDKLVQDGTISQETFDAIMEYMKENAPEKPEVNGERPDGMPEFNGEKPDDAPDLLKDLLNAGIITQEEYDTISSSGLDRAPAGKEPMGRAPFESRQRPDLEWNQEASVLA